MSCEGGERRAFCGQQRTLALVWRILLYHSKLTKDLLLLPACFIFRACGPHFKLIVRQCPTSPCPEGAPIGPGQEAVTHSLLARPRTCPGLHVPKQSGCWQGNSVIPQGKPTGSWLEAGLSLPSGRQTQHPRTAWRGRSGSEASGRTRRGRQPRTGPLAAAGGPRRLWGEAWEAELEQVTRWCPKLHCPRGSHSHHGYPRLITVKYDEKLSPQGALAT